MGSRHGVIATYWLLGRYSPVVFSCLCHVDVFGGVVRKTEFCPLGGIADIMHSGNHGRLRMYFFAIGISILGVTIMEALSILSVDNTRPPIVCQNFVGPVISSVDFYSALA